MLRASPGQQKSFKRGFDCGILAKGCQTGEGGGKWVAAVAAVRSISAITLRGFSAVCRSFS